MQWCQDFTRSQKMRCPKFYSFFLFTFLIHIFSFCEAQDCSNPPKTITVSKYNNANFKTIQNAIDSVPNNNSQWMLIKIAPGDYVEKVIIPEDKPCIYLEGAGRNSTSIQWNDHLRTSFSATFESKASNIVAKGITFENTYNHPRLLEAEPPIVQAVAAKIDGDKSAFFGCAFLGVQDTLYDSDGRHYFHDCYIQGATDFIFGNGQSIYEASVIWFSNGKFGPKDREGVITAQARDAPDETTGFVFNNCTITGEGKTDLGRAYGPYSRVIIANSVLTDVVKPEGWVAWTAQGHEGNVTYVEEGCRGAGADKSKRVPWMKHMSESELRKFLDLSYIDHEGWLTKLPTKAS